jgi:hypothetical protein
MSDNETIDYTPRTVDEVKKMHEQLVQPASFAGYQYVAAPAPGWDTEGVWTSFATAYRTGYSVHAIAASYALSEGLGLPTQLIPHRYVDIDPGSEKRLDLSVKGVGMDLFKEYFPIMIASLDADILEAKNNQNVPLLKRLNKSRAGLAENPIFKSSMSKAKKVASLLLTFM